MKFIKVILLAAAVLVFALGLAVFATFSYIAQDSKNRVEQDFAQASKHARVTYDSLGISWLNAAVSVKNLNVTMLMGNVRIQAENCAIRDLKLWGVDLLPPSYQFKNISISSPLVSGGRINIGSLQISEVSRSGDLLTRLRFSLKGLALKIDNDNTTEAREVRKLGLDSINLNIDWQYKYNIAAKEKQGQLLISGIILDISRYQEPFVQNLKSMGYKTINITYGSKYKYKVAAKEQFAEINLGAADMGEVFISTHLSNVEDLSWLFKGDADPWRQLEEILKGSPVWLKKFTEITEAGKNVFLHDIQIGYKDRSLAKKLLAFSARSEKMSVSQLAESINTAMEIAVALLPLPPKLTAQIATVKQFINNPKEIKVEVAFKKPVQVGRVQLNSLDEVVKFLQLLDIKITSAP